MSYKTKVSIESLANELEEDRALARSLGQAGAAIQATTLKAKLFGLLVDRKESGAPGDFAGLQRQEILDKIAARHGKCVAESLARALADKPDELEQTSGTLN